MWATIQVFNPLLRVSNDVDDHTHIQKFIFKNIWIKGLDTKL